MFAVAAGRSRTMREREREIGDGRVVVGWSDLYRIIVNWRGAVTEEVGCCWKDTFGRE